MDSLTDKMKETDIKAEPIENIKLSDFQKKKCKKYVVPETKFEVNESLEPVKYLYIGSEDTEIENAWFDNILNKKFITLDKSSKETEPEKPAFFTSDSNKPVFGSSFNFNGGSTSNSNSASAFSPAPVFSFSNLSTLPVPNPSVSPVSKPHDGHTGLDINSKYFFYRYGLGFDKLIAFRDDLTKLAYQVNYKTLTCSFVFQKYVCPSCFGTECDCYVRYCPLLSFSTDSKFSAFAFTFDSSNQAKMTYENNNFPIVKSLEGSPLEAFISFLDFVAEEIERKHHYNRIFIQ